MWRIQLDDDFDDNSWKKDKLPTVAPNKKDTSKQLITKITILKECFQGLKDHIYDHSRFNFDYYFSAEIKSYLNIKNIIEDNKTDLNNFSNDFVEVYSALDFNSIIKSIHVLNNDSKSFVVIKKYEIYDKWNIDDLYAFLIKSKFKKI
jgi:hypothetical protein